MDNLARFAALKTDAEAKYRSINQVYCPYLKRPVNFNAKGLRHVLFKEWNRARPLSDQYIRLKFIHLAPKIISLSGTLQEVKKIKSYERVDYGSRWKNLAVQVSYYGFVAIVSEKIRFKVVVKEVRGGQPFFWSIIPFWRNRRDPLTQQIKKVFREGDLESD